MRKKIIILILIMFVVPLLIPSMTAMSTNETTKKFFHHCYIEATGEIEFTWQLNDLPIGLRNRFISFWPVVFNEPNADVTIYSRKNGKILWEDTFESGQWVLYLVNFFGKYNNDGSTDETLIANLDGSAGFILIKTLKDGIDKSVIQGSESITPAIPIKQRYKDCYFEVSGYMHHDWPAVIKLPNMVQIAWLHELDASKIRFGLYSYVLFEEDVSIKIYDDQDGNLIWQHQGTMDPLLTIVGFSGKSIIDDQPGKLPHIILNGDARFLSIKLKNYPES